MSETPKPLDMRYDGAPRRSQKAEKDWLDHVWSFFSSVKVGVWLIVLTLVGAAIGSVYPQEEAFLSPPGLDYYAERYGTLGKWYYLLGFSHTYTSWWFQLLVLMLGTSIVVASLDRGVPLYKALKKQKPDRTVDFLRRQALSYETDLPFDAASGEEAARRADELEAALKKLRYRTSRAGNAVLGEKNRWSRWGPYVNHVGLIIFLLIILVRTLPGFTLEEYVSVLEGDTVPIPGTNYYVKNEKFTAEFYDNEELRGQFREEQRLVPKLYKTEAVLYECIDRCGTSAPELVEVKRGDILVNQPMEYRGLSVYQFGYEATPQIRSVTVTLNDKETGEAHGPFTLKTHDPDLAYEAGPYKLRLVNYYPEFALDANGQPTTTSAATPNAPAYIFQITGPDLPEEGASYLYFPREIDKVRFNQDAINAAVGIGNKFEIAAGGMENVEIAQFTSTLTARKDLTVPYLLVGGAICMLGLVMGFYWQHRRIWVRIDGNRLTLGAHTNKNWHGMKRETAKLFELVGLEPAAALSAGTKEREST
ncbi:cytochrome c biogenesis protein ResB [Paenibacillus sp.]|uniref:cytochrome c biogenesis protein ResB n=1 Tax=Paenibacillus sp. TaxID=58172 RepID=UPI002D4581F6|nr:cytochrome c biogenesis protein ResB [Paenibacillus sp.]HZG85202.1 cytochrome c biogenesis protein ResB [Paenibacillus sp.]